MTEEPATMEEEPAIQEGSPFAAPERRNGSGPGFLLGIVLGVVAGAAAATLLAPAAGEELRHRLAEEAHPEGDASQVPLGRMRSVLDRVRARMQDASSEAREAAREAEARSRARYEELTR